MDARVAKTREAVMQAAFDLLLEKGPDGLTVDAVVARSGVAKSTVYRHWATRDILVADVFSECAPQFAEPDPDIAFEPALRLLVSTFLDMMNDERWKRLIPALLLLKTQKAEMAQLDGEMNQAQSEVISNVFRRGVDEGILRPSVLDDLETEITLLVGPILMAGLIDHVPLDDELGRRVVDQFLAAHHVGAPAAAVTAS